jgi:hypothetical protein
LVACCEGHGFAVGHVPRLAAFPCLSADRRRLDLVSVGRRLGNGSPAITLGVYAHAFTKTDDAAPLAIEAAMKAGAEPARQ